MGVHIQLVKNQHEDKHRPIPKDIYNQLIKITNDPDFQALRLHYQKLINKSTSTNLSMKDLVDCKSASVDYVKNNNLPTNWEEPIFNMMKQEGFDFPLDNGIELIVGDVIITGMHSEILKVKNIKTGHLNIDRKVSIVLTSKTTTEHIIHFLKSFKEDIEFWQRVAELPDYNNSNWRRLPLAQKIIKLKDIDKLTFSEITDKFSKDDSLTEVELDYLSNENNIKSLYYDYKKHLKMK